MLAGLSSLGPDSMLMMDSTMDSTVCTGDQRSEAAAAVVVVVMVIDVSKREEEKLGYITWIRIHMIAVKK